MKFQAWIFEIEGTVTFDVDAELWRKYFVHEVLGLVVEPAGIAPLIEHEPYFRTTRAATVLCGGNVTPGQIRRWLCPPAAAGERVAA